MRRPTLSKKCSRSRRRRKLTSLPTSIRVSGGTTMRTNPSRTPSTRTWISVTAPSGSTTSTCGRWRRPCSGRDEVDVVGTHANQELRAVGRPRACTCSSSMEPTGASRRGPPSACRQEVHRHQVHPRRADEPATNAWPAADRPRAAARAARAAVAQDGDAVAERHRLFLIVGHVDHGRAEPPVQRASSARVSTRSWRRGWTAARRAGTPAARAPSRGRARPAGAGRPTAARLAVEHGSSPGRGVARTRASASRPAPTPRMRRPKARLSRTVLCG